MREYQTHQLGIVFGPYGTVGYVGTIQKDDLKEVAKTFFQLFCWAKNLVKKFISTPSEAVSELK